MKKTNKTFKRFAAITSASLLAACAVIPAISTAADIKIDGFNTTTANDDGTHTYEAYQIFDGDISGEGENKVLVNITWGTGIDSTKYQELLDALAAKNVAFAESVTYSIPAEATDLKDGYDAWVATKGETDDKSENAYYESLNPTDDAEKIALFKENRNAYTYTATNDKSAEKIADILATATQAIDDVLAKDFAAVVGEYLSNVSETSEVVDTATDKYAKGDIVISDLSEGYYLVQDTSDSPSNVVGDDNTGAKTRYILRVVDNDITVNAKSSAPSVQKKVQEDDKYTGTEYGTGYNDVADHTIGDTIGFKLIGTLPSTYDDYSAYYYQFTDTYASTLDTIDANKDDKVDVVVKYYGKDVPLSGDPSGTIASTYYDVVEANNSFTVTFSNLKEISAIDKDTKIVVEYAAKLTSDAVIGLPGQENKVDLTYSNNPYWNGNSESLTTGTTPEDKVIVFTYEVDINKTDGTNPLTGAKFVLKNADDEYAIVNASGQLTGWTTTKPTVNEDGTITDTVGAILPEQSGAKFIVKGLDDNETYVLEEIKAPAGYNLLTDTYNVTLNADTENGQEWTGVAADALSELTLSYKMTNATDDATIVDNEKTNHNYEAFDITNKKGTQLPGTGGIGTTIFYLGGGAMAAIGGIYLISKRRMKKSEE